MNTPIDYLKLLGLLILVVLVLVLCARVGAYRATIDDRYSKNMWTSPSTIIWMILTPVLSCSLIVAYIYLVWPIN